MRETLAKKRGALCRLLKENRLRKSWSNVQPVFGLEARCLLTQCQWLQKRLLPLSPTHERTPSWASACCCVPVQPKIWGDRWREVYRRNHRWPRQPQEHRRPHCRLVPHQARGCTLAGSWLWGGDQGFCRRGCPLPKKIFFRLPQQLQGPNQERWDPALGKVANFCRQHVFRWWPACRIQRFPISLLVSHRYIMKPHFQE